MNLDPTNQDPLEQILLRHDELIAAGVTTPELQEYLNLYPDLADELKAYFADEQLFKQEAGLLCALAGTGAGEPLPIRSFGKYEVLRKEGGGGMGIVVRAFDCEVKREVVLKVLKKEGLANPDQVRRFRLEGQILGQLIHPNIVPLHEMAETPAKEPYLAMKLVRGRTLGWLLEQRQSREERREWFLDVFVQICHAVAYAHDKHVLHRDLKPANVMVGEHEEVQLADFGLAKVMGSRPSGPARAGPVPVVDRGAETVSGIILGTPGYMAPEQARGEIESLDESCDVFGLGGILCVILTAEPPRMKTDVQCLLQDCTDPQAASLAGALERLDRCGGPAPLVALGKQCLAPSRADRPPSARAVAEAVLAYRAALAQAVREKDLEAAAANERAKQAIKKRRLAYASLAAVLLAVGVGIIALWINVQREADAAEIARVERETTSSVTLLVKTSRERRAAARQAELDDIERLFQEAVALAIQAAEQARRGPTAASIPPMAEKALAEAKTDLALLSKDRQLMTRLLEILVFAENGDIRGALQAKDMSAQVAFDAEQQLATAFRAWGLDPYRTSLPDAVARIRSRPDAIVVELVNGLELWAHLRRLQKLDPRRLLELAEEADQPDPHRQQIRKLRGARPLDRARLLKLAGELKPASEAPLTLGILARVLWEVGEHNLMESLLRAAVQARPKDALLRAHLGTLYFMRGTQAQFKRHLNPELPNKIGTATDSDTPFQEAIACFEALRTLRPECQLMLAVARVNTHRYEEGLGVIQKLRKERKSDPLLLVLEATALARKGKLLESGEVAKKLAHLGGDSDLGHVGRMQQVAAALEAKDWKKAETLCREVLKSSKQPLILTLAFQGLGGALNGQGKAAEAIKALGEASRISQAIPSGHVYMAQLLEKIKDLKGAERLLLRGLEEDPENAALVLYGIDFYRRQGNKPKAADLKVALSKTRFPDDAPSLYKVGFGLIGVGELRLAEKAFRKLLQSEPDHFEGNANLAGILNQLGQYQEAKTIGAHLVKLKPNISVGHYLQGWSLYGQQNWAEAEIPLRKTLDMNPNDPDACLLLGDTLRHLKKTDEAEKFLHRGLKLVPDHPEGRYWHSAAHFWLSEVLRTQGKTDEAREMYEKSLKLKAERNP